MYHFQYLLLVETFLKEGYKKKTRNKNIKAIIAIANASKKSRPIDIPSYENNIRGHKPILRYSCKQKARGKKKVEKLCINLKPEGGNKIGNKITMYVYYV